MFGIIKSIIVLFLGFTVFLFSGSLLADDKQKEKISFSVASLDGTYVMASTGAGGTVGPEALFGVLKFEGDGSFVGSLENNTGVFLGQRTVTSYDVLGTYDITDVGRGTLDLRNIPGLGEAIFVTTQTQILNRKIIATEISFVTRERSASGNTISGKIVRRTYDGELGAEAMTGDFGFVNSGLGGVAPGIALGDVNWDAKTGIVKGDFTISAVDPSGERVLFDFFSGGPYTPDNKNDGTGTTFSDTTGGSSHYVVTKVKAFHGKLVAEEIFFVPEFLDPLGNFSPAFMTRISN